MDLKVLGFAVSWIMLLSAGVIVGCYFWYNSTEDKASQAFSIIVPIILIGTFIYGGYEGLSDEPKGGRRKRKLR
jgi:hypothetical protein